MSRALALASTEQSDWLLGAGAALAAHAALGALLLGMQAGAETHRPEPVMVVELAAGVAPAAPSEAEQPVAEPESLPDMVDPRLDIPEVKQPLPPDPVVAPPPREIPRVAIRPAREVAPQPMPVAARPSAVAPMTSAAAEAGDGPGDDPRAKQKEADWYSLVSVHLNRMKRYPREAKKAGQQGTPTVRFTVDRRGRVSEIAITRSSGFGLLDAATVELMERAAPLPAMPSSMRRERVTISLPIEYSLSRK